MSSGLGFDETYELLHVMVTEAVVCPELLRADEVLELSGVTHEEHWSVVPDHIVVALVGVEALQLRSGTVLPAGSDSVTSRL
jgi:hypothetical protein